MRALLLLLPLALFAEKITLDRLSTMPRSLPKNFYIEEFLKQDITNEEATKAFYQYRNVNFSFLKKYAKKVNDTEILKILECRKLPPSKYLTADINCVKMSLSTYNLTKLNQKQLLELATRLKGESSFFEQRAKLMASDDVMASIKSNKEFIALFTNCGATYRAKYIAKLSTKKIQELAKEPSFDKFVRTTMNANSLKRLQKRFINLESKYFKHVTFYTMFDLALRAIELEDEKSALKLLKVAKSKAYFSQDRDKALFWLYLVSEDKNWLNELAKSQDINIYSLMAMDEVRTEPSTYFVPIIYSKAKLTNVKDPFKWEDIRRDIRRAKSSEAMEEMIKRYDKAGNLPVKSFILEKFYKYKRQPFITPYRNYIKTLQSDDLALFYALARQESYFIAGRFSTSYAMGIMQIMPYVARYIAEQKGMKTLDIDTMFEPKRNIEFGEHHYKWLKKHLKNPMIIAYAYNGGYGFAKRKIIKRGIFKSKNKYQPYWGLEKVPYREAREYGKKVIAFYAIYKRIFEPNSKHKNLIQNLLLDIQNF